MGLGRTVAGGNDNRAPGLSKTTAFTIDGLVEELGLGKFQLFLSLFIGLGWVGCLMG